MASFLPHFLLHVTLRQHSVFTVVHAKYSMRDLGSVFMDFFQTVRKCYTLPLDIRDCNKCCFTAFHTVAKCYALDFPMQRAIPTHCLTSMTGL